MLSRCFPKMRKVHSLQSGPLRANSKTQGNTPMKNRFLILAIAVASLSLSQTSNADIVNILNLDPTAGSGVFSTTVSTVGTTHTVSFTGTDDFDGGGTNDILTFDMVYEFHTGSSYSGTSPNVTTNLGTAALPTSSGQNWGDNTFGGGDTLSLLIQNIAYTDGEMDGNAIVFNGFTAIREVDLGAGSINVAVGGALTGQTIVATPDGGDIDLSSLGNSAQLFLTSDAGNGNIRLRDLDLQFSTTAVPEPSTFTMLGLAIVGLISRRHRV